MNTMKAILLLSKKFPEDYGGVKPSPSMSEKVLDETLKYQRKVGNVDVAVIPFSCNKVDLLHETIETVKHFNHINALLRLCGQSSRIRLQLMSALS